MEVDIIISADYIREDIIKNKIVVVIDMLRATSVITTAIMNGCKEVIPVLTVEEAFSKKEKLNNVLLGGERKAVKIDGFNFSNSPLEYTEDIVKDNVIVLSTTNGTRALTSCLSAKEIFVGCMLNAKALAKVLVEKGQDVVIVNAGTNGQFSMDDYICSGLIIKEMMDISNKLNLSDIAISSLKTYSEHTNVLSYIKDARHYKVMMDLDLGKDIEYCIQKNITDIVPQYKDGTIK